MDTNTGLVVLGAAIGSKDLIVKILGPTAEYLGDGLKNWAEIRINNVANILNRAHRISGDRINEKGSVPPRVLKEILDEGSFCEDQLMAEYFGGVLASSRTNDAADDRASSYIAIISRLSSYQIRTHYLLYRLLKELYDGTELNIGETTDRLKMQIYIPIEVFASVMDLDMSDHERMWAVLSHSFLGLAKEDLLEGGNFAMGPVNTIITKSPFKEVTSPGFTFTPSPFGIALFTWVHGYPNMLLGNFLNTASVFSADTGIEIPVGCKRLG